MQIGTRDGTLGTAISHCLLGLYCDLIFGFNFLKNETRIEMKNERKIEQ
jgi:hypothetical protein